MTDLLREAPLGQLIRWASGNRLLKYPEELSSFELPAAYKDAIDSASKQEPASPQEGAQYIGRPSKDKNRAIPAEKFSERKPSSALNPADHDRVLHPSRTKSRTETAPYTRDEADIEPQLALQKSDPIMPQTTRDGIILVDWYTEDDQDNPQNWSNSKRFVVSFIIGLYTWVVYSASAIYTSSEKDVMEKFNIGPTTASLPLSLYVLAYGIGPLLWSPLSEIPAIGRSPVYAITMGLFTILSLPTALVDNFAGLLVLRFLQGFLGSPCLATGGATMQDIYSLLHLPFAL